MSMTRPACAGSAQVRPPAGARPHCNRRGALAEFQDRGAGVNATEDRLRALMLRGLAGDAAAHNRLLSELAILLRGFYSRRLGGDPSDAEDLVQETLIAVHSRRESYDPSKAFTSWAFSMARYKMIDEFRRRRVRTSIPIEDVEDLFAADAIA